MSLVGLFQRAAHLGGDGSDLLQQGGSEGFRPQALEPSRNGEHLSLCVEGVSALVTAPGEQGSACSVSELPTPK